MIKRFSICGIVATCMTARALAWHRGVFKKVSSINRALDHQYNALEPLGQILPITTDNAALRWERLRTQYLNSLLRADVESQSLTGTFLPIRNINVAQGVRRLPRFLSMPLPGQCKGVLPVHKSGMSLSASRGPRLIKTLLCPSFTSGEPTVRQ